jgi:NAD(P)-dependent dehydrogenase (short-subunit alcohol dehydrogenase family)
MAATGAKVFLAVRSLEKAQIACSHFLGSGRVELLECDVSSLESVRKAAAAFLVKSQILNVLICNAGIMMVPQREESADGFESQLATNYLGHFLLFWLLRNAMVKGSTPRFNSRVTSVTYF